MSNLVLLITTVRQLVAGSHQRPDVAPEKISWRLSGNRTHDLAHRKLRSEWQNTRNNYERKTFPSRTSNNLLFVITVWVLWETEDLAKKAIGNKYAQKSKHNKRSKDFQLFHSVNTNSFQTYFCWIAEALIQIILFLNWK